MKTLSIADDIVPVAEFKASISKWLKSIQNTGHPLVITQNGKPAGVLLLIDVEYEANRDKGGWLVSADR